VKGRSTEEVQGKKIKGEGVWKGKIEALPIPMFAV
jgi:hypothetical protein